MNASVVRYDLFLSYSHKDSETAQKIVKMLQDLNPKLKIFFDVQELKTGMMTLICMQCDMTFLFLLAEGQKNLFNMMSRLC